MAEPLHPPVATLAKTGAAAMTTTAARPVTIDYAMRRHALQSNLAARAAGNGVATMKLFASGKGFEACWELLEMQQALLRQLQDLQQNYLKGLEAWGRDCAALRRANTLSKMVEQECNLAGQFNQLLSDQATDLVTLMESFQIGYGFWVSQKLES